MKDRQTDRREAKNNMSTNPEGVGGGGGDRHYSQNA